MVFASQLGHSGTNKSCRIRLLYASIFQETKPTFIELVLETVYFHLYHLFAIICGRKYFLQLEHHIELLVHK